MKKNTMSKLASVVACMAALCMASSASALVIDPAQCGITLSCDSGSENGNSEIIAAVEALYPGISEVYKDNVGGGEEFSFADSYTTEYFNSPSDPEDATITWDGPDTIDCNECWLLVKDGNQDPGWYLIDLTGWDGQETLELQDFWPAQGAISHVSLFVRPIPVPAAVWMFASALLGLTVMRRRTGS